MLNRIDYQGAHTPWWPDLRRPLYIVGPTGSGKSSLMYNIMHRIAMGAYPGCAALGSSIRMATWPRMSSRAFRESGWSQPSGLIRPTWRGRLASTSCPTPQIIRLEAEHTTEAFASIWKLEPRHGAALEACVHSAQLSQDSTLFDCLKMFLNPDYRKRIVQRCGNRITQQFWQKEFPLWELTPRFKADRVDPVVAMFETLLQHPALQRIFGQAAVDGGFPPGDGLRGHDGL